MTTYGPIHLTDRAKGDPSPVPFGSQPEWDIPLPWQKRADARRLAKYLGLTLEEW